MKEHEIPCELCGEVYDPDELIPFDDRLICPECLENETTLCACCGQRIWLTDNAGNDNTPLCQTCYDQSYMTCSGAAASSTVRTVTIWTTAMSLSA